MKKRREKKDCTSVRKKEKLKKDRKKHRKKSGKKEKRKRNRKTEGKNRKKNKKTEIIHPPFHIIHGRYENHILTQKQKYLTKRTHLTVNKIRHIK